jgi:unsaturated rhamnogalacturonyl hydrolase
MKNLYTLIFFLSALLSTSCLGQGSTPPPVSKPWSARIAESFLLRHPGAVTYDSGSPSRKWNYEQGLMLVSLLRMWQHSGDRKYFDFVQANLDRYVSEAGSIQTYSLGDYNLDNISPGKAVLAVYGDTRQEKFRAAADTLRQQLRGQPRTREGGFWHKKIYPFQMWLDGLFMAEPFYARYAAMFGDTAAFDDIAEQFIRIARHTTDQKTGLLSHAWDESKKERWANPRTGCSPTFWGRAMGWYAMGLVDALDDIPKTHPKRPELISILQNLSDALVRYRDAETHLWNQVLDQGKRSGNYLESSASCMFAYCFAKGSRMGYLDKKFSAIAQESFDGIVRQETTIDALGFVDLHGTCGATGLGGNPYRDGSFEYYTGEPQRTNDLRGIGAFLLAAVEVENGSPVTTKESKR